MKVQAIIFAMAVAAVSASPAVKRATDEPLEFHKGSVKADVHVAGDEAHQAALHAKEAIKYSTQAGLDAAAKVALPVAHFGGNATFAGGNIVARTLKNAGAFGINVIGHTLQTGNAIGAKALSLSDNAMRATYDLADGLSGSAAKNAEAQHRQVANLDEQLSHGADNVRSTIHSASASVQSVADSASERVRSASKDLHESAKESRDAAKDAQAEVEVVASKPSFWSRARRTVYSTEESAAAKTKEAAQAVADKAAAKEQDARENKLSADAEVKSAEGDAKFKIASTNGAASHFTIATAGVVAVLATAVTMF